MIPITDIISYAKDIGTSMVAAPGVMTGIEAATEDDGDETSILVKSLVSIIAGCLTGLLRRLFRRKKK